MHDPKATHRAFDSRHEDRLLDVLIRAALGGMARAGILGQFVGATLLALGYQIFMVWVAANRVARRPAGDASETAAD